MPKPGATEQGKARLNWRLWTIVAAAVVLVIFVAQNSQQVVVDFLFTRTETPLIFALLIAGALGALIGWLAPLLRRSHRGRD